MFEKEVLSLWFCHFKFSNPISSWIWCTIPPLPLNVQKQFNLHCSQKLTFHLSLLLDYRSDSYHFNLSILISASKWFSSYKYIRAQTSLKRTKFFYFAAIYLSLAIGLFIKFIFSMSERGIKYCVLLNEAHHFLETRDQCFRTFLWQSNFCGGRTKKIYWKLFDNLSSKCGQVLE